MIRQLYDVLLHHKTKHTNIEMPGCKYIAANVFPEQISELINTEITLKYRNHNIIDNYNEPSSGRPSDDSPWVSKPNTGPEYSGDPSDVYEDKFIVLRADSTEPYRLIARSLDYKMILINSTEIDDSGEYKFKTIISEYPVQDNTYFGLEIQDQYVGEIDELGAVTLRVDAGEPTYSVLVEFLGSTGIIRFVLGDEVFSKIQDRYDINGDYDYDNKNASDYGEFVDVDGYYANHSDITHIKNIDGGNAGNVTHILADKRAGEFPEYYDVEEPDIEVTPLVEISDDEKAEFFEKLIEGKVIYGTV